MNFDFDATKKKEPKCVNCGKSKGEHHARNTACPIGAKHRVLGYTQFSGTSFFYSSTPQHCEGSKDG